MLFDYLKLSMDNNYNKYSVSFQLVISSLSFGKLMQTKQSLRHNYNARLTEQ